MAIRNICEILACVADELNPTPRLAICLSATQGNKHMAYIKKDF